MNILYKISGYDGDYVLRCYKCSKLDKKFSLSIPLKEDSFEYLSIERIDELYEDGYIDEFQYRALLHNADIDEKWFYAIDKKGVIYASIVKRKGDRLVGHYPTFIDKNRASIIWSIYALIYFPLSIYLAFKIVNAIFGGPYG